MKINFTKTEYRRLLDIIYLGQWMIDAHDTESSQANEGYEMLVQKIYSYAKEMGCEELIDASKTPAGYYPTRVYEDESQAHPFIDKYNAENFWEELITRLAERDTHIDAEAANKDLSTAEEFWELSMPHELRYAEEFEKHGLSRLEIRETKSGVVRTN